MGNRKSLNPKNKRVTFLVTENERKTILKNSLMLDMTESEMIRQALFGMYFPFIDKELQKEGLTNE